MQKVKSLKTKSIQKVTAAAVYIICSLILYLEKNKNKNRHASQALPRGNLAWH